MFSRVRPFISLCLACLIGVNVYISGVLNARGQRIENRLLEQTELDYAPHGLLNLMNGYTIAGALLLILFLCVLTRGILASVRVLFASALALALSQILKHGILDRPSFITEAQNSFPSGHVTVIATISAALIWVVPASLRPLATLVGTILTSVVAIQVIDSAWHRPSDVIGALMLTQACFALIAFIVPPSVHEDISAVLQLFSKFLTFGSIIGILFIGILAFIAHSDSVLVFNLSKIFLVFFSYLVVREFRMLTRR